MKNFVINRVTINSLDSAVHFDLVEPQKSRVKTRNDVRNTLGRINVARHSENRKVLKNYRVFKKQTM